MSLRTPDFKIGESDQIADIPATFVDKDGDAVDITGAAVRFRMRSRWSSTALIDAAATIISAAAGTVEYRWAAGDTALLAVGDNWAQFDATIAGERFTAPNDDMLLIHVQKSVVA